MPAVVQHMARLVDGHRRGFRRRDAHRRSTPASTPRPSASPDPPRRTQRSRRAVAAGITINLESRRELEVALAVGKRVADQAASCNPSESTLRTKGRRNEDGWLRKAVRHRCRARAGAVPQHRSGRRGVGRPAHLCGLAVPQRPKPWARPRPRHSVLPSASPSNRGAGSRQSISAAASAFRTSRVTSRWTWQLWGAALNALMSEARRAPARDEIRYRARSIPRGRSWCLHLSRDRSQDLTWPGISRHGWRTAPPPRGVG